MISESMKNILQQLQRLQVDYDIANNNKAHFEGAAKERLESAAIQQTICDKINLEMDRLQLELRKVMNGEESTVVVAPPVEAEVEIGRQS